MVRFESGSSLWTCPNNTIYGSYIWQLYMACSIWLSIYGMLYMACYIWHAIYGYYIWHDDLLYMACYIWLAIYSMIYIYIYGLLYMACYIYGLLYMARPSIMQYNFLTNCIIIELWCLYIYLFVCPWTPPRVLKAALPNLAWVLSGSLGW